MKHSWYISSFLLSSALILSLNGCGNGSNGNISGGGNRTPVAQDKRNYGLSGTGIQYTQEVPFSKETIAEIKEREPKKKATAPEQRAVPFQEMPPPIDLKGASTAKGGIYSKKREKDPAAPYVEPPLAPPLNSNFIGIEDNNTGIPPDTMGAAGPSHLVEILNNAVAFFNKSTGAKISQVSLQNFWSSLGTANRPFDPKVIYDRHTGRFIMATLGHDSTTADSSWLMIAVSETSDPTGAWYKWAIDADKDGGVQIYNNWADYPGLGVNADYLFVTANMYNNGNTYQYGKAWVIPKAQLLGGSGTITLTEFRNPTGSGPTMQPAHVFGSYSAQYLIHEGYFISGTPPRRAFRIASITFPGGTPVWTDLGYIEVASYPSSVIPGAPQLGSSYAVDTG